MAVSTSFKAFVLERLETVAPVKAKAMFGGVGLYAEGLFFALMDDDRLYFKVDEASRGAYEARGMGPFDPYKDGRVMAGYYEVPPEVVEEDEDLGPWMREALRVAAAKAAGSRRRRGSVGR